VFVLMAAVKLAMVNSAAIIVLKVALPATRGGNPLTSSSSLSAVTAATASSEKKESPDGLSIRHLMIPELY